MGRTSASARPGRIMRLTVSSRSPARRSSVGHGLGRCRGRRRPSRAWPARAGRRRSGAAPRRPRSPCSPSRARRARAAAGPSRRRPGGRRAPRRRPRRPAIARQLLARAARRRERLVQQRLAVDGELAAGGVERASSSDDGEVERTRRTARAERGRRRSGRVGATWSIALCVSEPTILCVEVSTASAPCRQRARRQVGVEAEVRAPGLVDDERHAGRVRDLGAARRRRRPCRSRSARR